VPFSFSSPSSEAQALFSYSREVTFYKEEPPFFFSLFSWPLSFFPQILVTGTPQVIFFFLSAGVSRNSSRRTQGENRSSPFTVLTSSHESEEMPSLPSPDTLTASSSLSPPLALNFQDFSFSLRRNPDRPPFDKIEKFLFFLVFFFPPLNWSPASNWSDNIGSQVFLTLFFYRCSPNYS